eukprot:8779124-Pyramimonas_sp.AAC.1
MQQGMHVCSDRRAYYTFHCQQPYTSGPRFQGVALPTAALTAVPSAAHTTTHLAASAADRTAH